MATPLDVIPVFQRGGSILPLKFRVRRSSTQMQRDPITLQIAPDRTFKASGDLYLDDGKSFANRKGDYLHRQFQFDKNVIRSAKAHLEEQTVPSTPSASLLSVTPNVERIIVFNWQSKPSRIVVTSNTVKQNISIDSQVQLQQVLDFDYDAKNKKLVIRKPNLSVAAEWEIQIL